MEYEYVLRGNALGSGTFDTTSIDTAFVGGLTENTEYDLYIREICRRGDTSIWIGPIEFKTPCVAERAPFSEDFDNGAANLVPECWAEYKTYDLGGVQSGAKIAGFNSFSFPNNLELDSWFGFGATDTIMSITPRFEDMSSANMEISFYTSTNDLINNLFVGTTNGQLGGPVTILDTIFYGAN